MNKATKRFLNEIRIALKDENEEYLKHLINYELFDYRVDKKIVEQWLKDNGYWQDYQKLISKIDKKKINKRKYIKMQLEDILYDLVDDFLKTNMASKLIEEFSRQIEERIVEEDEVFIKRHIDKIINYTITKDKIAKNITPYFILYLKAKKII